MKTVLTTHRVLAWILLAGLVVRLAILGAVQSTELKVVDEQHYAELAASVADGRGFAWADGRATSMRPPLYPMFIAAVWSLTGTQSAQAVRAAQILLSLGTVVLLYWLALRLTDRRTAILAAAAFCFYPSFLFSGALLLTEVLVTFWLVLLANAYFALARRPGGVMAASVGATVGLAALTRSVFWPYPIFLVPLAFFSLDGSIARRARLVAVMVLAYAAVVGPWAVRNTRLQRTVTVVDTMGGMNLRMGNYEHTPIDRMWDAVALTGEKSWSHQLSVTAPEARGWTDGQKEKWAQRAAIAYMSDHPEETLIRSAVKFADFWGMERELLAGLMTGLYRPPAWAAVLMAGSVILAYPLIALGACVGVFRARVSSLPTHLFVVSVALLLTGVHTVVFGHSRYHLPLVPFLAIYAAAALTQQSWRSLVAEPRRAVAPMAAIAVLLAIWGREVVVRDVERVQGLLKLLA